MALSLRDFEVFRGDPAALPEAMATRLATIAPVPEVLRVAKLASALLAAMPCTSPSRLMTKSREASLLLW